MWNCGKDDLSRGTSASSTYLHQTVGKTGAGLSIASSNHSMKMLANTGEVGELTMGEHYLYKEEEDEQQLPFLDRLISRTLDGGFTSKVYRKPSASDRFLRFDSHHPLTVKRGSIKYLTTRARKLCSIEESEKAEIRHISKALQCNNYPRHHWSVPIINRSDVVYKISCECGICYTDQIGRSLKDRIYEHQKCSEKQI